jgi:hypothetical protein
MTNDKFALIIAWSSLVNVVVVGSVRLEGNTMRVTVVKFERVGDLCTRWQIAKVSALACTGGVRGRGA